MLAPALAVAVKAVAGQTVELASRLQANGGSRERDCLMGGDGSMFRAGGQRLRGAVGVIIARVEEVCRSVRPQTADGSECCGHGRREVR